MKVAIATTKKSPDSEISKKAGRSPFYLVFNEKKEVVSEIKNPFTTGGGAGFSVAKMLKNEGVDKIILGNIGGNMKEALEERGIEIHIEKGSAEEALKRVLSS